jgi:hypothetical protein
MLAPVGAGGTTSGTTSTPTTGNALLARRFPADGDREEAMDIVSRAEWGATAPLGPSMRLPAQGLHVHHSVTTATGNPAADMRTIERIGVQRFGRISYSWCLHPRGTILEGAGLTVGAHTGGFNSTSFGVCLIGNYQIDRVTDAQVGAFQELRAHLAATRRLAPGHYVQPHRARTSTICPGANVLARWGALLAPQEDIMASIEEMKVAMRQVLNEGTIRGQTNWAGSNKVVGDRTGHIINQLNAIGSAVDDVDLDVESLARDLVPVLAANLEALTDEDLAAMAKAVSDEQSRRDLDG